MSVVDEKSIFLLGNLFGISGELSAIRSKIHVCCVPEFPQPIRVESATQDRRTGNCLPAQHSRHDASDFSCTEVTVIDAEAARHLHEFAENEKLTLVKSGRTLRNRVKVRSPTPQVRNIHRTQEILPH